MTTEEIVEGNRLIAEFMGYKQRENGGLFWGNDGLGGLYPKDLKYHSSWDWLMPVVEKIINSNCSSAELCGEWYLNSSKYSFSMLNDQTNSCEGNSKNSLIEATWLAVVEFIKWYNENK